MILLYRPGICGIGIASQSLHRYNIWHHFFNFVNRFVVKSLLYFIAYPAFFLSLNAQKKGEDVLRKQLLQIEKKLLSLSQIPFIVMK